MFILPFFSKFIPQIMSKTYDFFYLNKHQKGVKKISTSQSVTTNYTNIRSFLTDKIVNRAACRGLPKIAGQKWAGLTLPDWHMRMDQTSALR